MGAQHTPGPWEVIEATEHHGFYVVTDYGTTVCDLYAMSNPIAASVRNGGTSYPVPFIPGDDGANARVIAAAPELLSALEDSLIMLGRLKKHCLITDNAGYTPDGRMLRLQDVEQAVGAAITKARGEPS